MTRRILLVGPVFHGYTTSIADALRRSGHVVDVHHYDAHVGVADRLRTKLGTELPRLVGHRGEAGRVARHRTAAAIDALRATRPDLVLAIKADVLDADFWEEARRAGALTHLWLYDELRRMDLDPAVLDAVDVLTSYSALDTAQLAARGLPATHVANGYDASRPVVPRPSGDVLFIGARYPNREALLVGLHQRGLPVRAVGRDWSHHPVDRLRTWDVRRPAVPATRDVDRTTSYGLMAGAAANLNLHHDQDGFTMRTFEIPGAGGLQLVDRDDVAIHYEPGTEVLVYRHVEEAAELARHALRDPGWARAIAAAGRARTLAHHTLDHRVREMEALWTA
ncbi:MAG TPA: glycosyltransferase [Ornithinibacter sp.]|nr:glycosyltransferase [Ornithinibacter sp.]